MPTTSISNKKQIHKQINYLNQCCIKNKTPSAQLLKNIPTLKTKNKYKFTEYPDAPINTPVNYQLNVW
jgi:hypothetical protein